MAQRRRRKRRGKQRSGRSASQRKNGQQQRPAGGAYARSRAKDEAARAALEPLRPGERPAAVTVGAIAAAALCVANLVALAVPASSSDGNSKPALAIFGALILALISYGMWRARYWAVLGMETVLALAMVGAAIALVSAANVAAVLLVVAILVPSALLFWFLIKAMARIQMPQRPGSS